MGDYAERERMRALGVLPVERQGGHRRFKFLLLFTLVMLSTALFCVKVFAQQQPQRVTPSQAAVDIDQRVNAIALYSENLETQVASLKQQLEDALNQLSVAQKQLAEAKKGTPGVLPKVPTTPPQPGKPPGLPSPPNGSHPASPSPPKK